MSGENIEQPLLPPGTLIIRAPRDAKHLTEPVMFEEESLPGFVRATLWAGAGLVGLFLAWASLVHIDEVATAVGQVVPSAAVKVVQHLEGGTVSAILVKEGDLVQAGQVLARLDPTPATSELDQTQARYVSLLLRSERLHAIIDKRAPDFTGIGQGYPELVADQERMWNGQVAAHASALAVMDSEIAQKSKELGQLRGMLATAVRQLEITRDQVGIRQQGLDAGVVSRQTYLETKRAEVAAEGEVQRLQQQVQVATDSLAEVQHRRQNLGETQAQDALSELGSVSAEIEQVKSALTKLKDRVARLEIKAPVTGIVQDMKVHTIGEVLPAGGILTRVVPTNGDLEAEVRLQPADIGHLQVGEPVKIKVSSFEYVRYGTLPGRLAKISATTFADEQGKPYYKGVISLDRTWMGPAKGQNAVLPGMSLEADIVTGNKTLIQYLLKPVFVSLTDSFHER